MKVGGDQILKIPDFRSYKSHIKFGEFDLNWVKIMEICVGRKVDLTFRETHK